jgi:uncharacterized protein YunC (DUF1805 family)
MNPICLNLVSVAKERKITALVAEGIERIEDVLTGKVLGLSKEEYLQAAR